MTEITRAQVDAGKLDWERDLVTVEMNLRQLRNVAGFTLTDGELEVLIQRVVRVSAYTAQLGARVGVLEAQAKDEIAWLVEIKNPIAPTWLARTLTDEGLLEWTTDHQKAIRFCRKEDAEAYISEAGWLDAFASEHMWMAPRPKAALAGKAAP